MPCPIPGPRLPAVTRLVSLYHEIRNEGPEYIDRLHRQYGPIVQTGPKHISMNDATGVNLITTVDGNIHQARRQPLQDVFSVRALEREQLQGAITTSVRRLRASLPVADTGGTDVTTVVRPMLQEVMSFVVYGKEHVLAVQTDAGQRAAIRADELQRTRLRNLWAVPTRYFPNAMLGLRWVESLMEDVQRKAYLDKIGRNALGLLQYHDYMKTAADRDSLLYHLFAKFQSEGPSQLVPSEEYILSECLNHFWAGVNKTASVIVPVLHYLSLPDNKGRQLRLRKELQACGINFAETAPAELSKRLKSLTYLDAILRETMRVDPPVSTGLDCRVSAREGRVSIHGHEIPLGWNVSSPAYSTHRNVDVFSHPDFYDPERWLVKRSSVKSIEDLKLEEERLKAMERHFFAFGAGPRMCIGVNVAWGIMRQVIAGIYSGFETSVAKRWVDDKEEIVFKRVG